MKSSAWTLPTDLSTQTGSTFRVLLLYDTFSSGKRAVELYESLLTQLQGEFEVSYSVRCMQILRFPRARLMTTRELLSANMIIVSSHTDDPLPAGFADWLNSSLARREDKPGALVALFDKCRTDFYAPTSSYAQLKDAARKNDLDFFAHASAGRGDERLWRDMMADSERDPLPPWADDFERFPDYSHCGINE